jgi:hypothetical protein
VEDHDRRCCHSRQLTWGFSCVFPGPQPHAVPCEMTRYRSRTEEARGSNPLTSTPNTAGQSVASAERAALSPFRGRAGAANAHGRVFDVGLGAAAEAGRPSEQPFAGLGPTTCTPGGSSSLLTRCAGFGEL